MKASYRFAAAVACTVFVAVPSAIASTSETSVPNSVDSKPSSMRTDRCSGVFFIPANDPGIKTGIGCHSFRATGITNYLENGGTLDKVQQMAVRTTKLYDRGMTR